MYKKVSELKGGETIRFRGQNIALENIVVIRINSGQIKIMAHSVKAHKIYVEFCNDDMEVFVYND